MSRPTGRFFFCSRVCFNARSEIRVRVALRLGDRETQILLGQVRRSARRLERIERARRVRGFPAAQITEATSLEPQLDATLALEQTPRLCGICRHGYEWRACRGAHGVDRGNRAADVAGPQQRLGFDQAHLAATREPDWCRRAGMLVLRPERYPRSEER